VGSSSLEKKKNLTELTRGGRSLGRKEETEGDSQVSGKRVGGCNSQHRRSERGINDQKRGISAIEPSSQNEKKKKKKKKIKKKKKKTEHVQGETQLPRLTTSAFLNFRREKGERFSRFHEENYRAQPGLLSSGERSRPRTEGYWVGSSFLKKGGRQPKKKSCKSSKKEDEGD